MEQAMQLSQLAFREKRWTDVISHTDRAISLMTDEEKSLGWKAFYRLGFAKAQLKDLSGAISDLEESMKRGAGLAVSSELADFRRQFQSEQVASDSRSSRNNSSTSPSSSFTSHPFTISSSNGKDLGVFATKSLRRGNLVFSESPLFKVRDITGVPSKVKTLSPPQLAKYNKLANSFSDRSSEVGIFETNAFNLGFEVGASPSAIFEVCSRFNHSCTPNCKASYDSNSSQLRIFALRTIEVGEELFTSYISRKDLFGSTRKNRQRILSVGWHFDCICSTCTLDEVQLKQSDQRRLRLAAIRESLIPVTSSSITTTTINPEEQLRSTGRALRLFKEENYNLDSSEFTNHSASICAFHQDFDSARIFAELAFTSTGEECGFDHESTVRFKTLLDNLHYEFAGTGVCLDFSKITKEIIESERESISPGSKNTIWKSLGVGIERLKV